MWKPPEYPGPCFDLHFDRFDGFIFEAEKPFENVCAAGASPVVSMCLMRFHSVSLVPWCKRICKQLEVSLFLL